MDATAVICPICLASPAEAEETIVEPQSAASSATSANTFLKTPCGHIFCKECIERVLIKPRDDSVPTRAPCPMCREVVSLFDLTHVTDVTSLAYGAETETSSWPIANSQFDQRSLIRIRNAESILRIVIDEKGAIEGYGIKFVFQEPSPSMSFDKPLKIALGCDWTELACNNDGDLPTLNSIVFDRMYFHERSMTFHGKIHFSNPVCNKGNYFYEELDCLLNFSSSAHYIRKGELRWRLASPTSNEGFSFPLDGTWKVQYSDMNSMIIYIQKHSFTSDGQNYHITLDEDQRPRFIWPPGQSGESIEQTSDQQILPRSGLNVGETLSWTTNSDEYKYKRIVWKRLATIDNSWRSFRILAGNFVYQKSNQTPGDGHPLVPSYQAETLWGNTFCQAYSVGMASYHFMEPDSDGNHQAYISYESPKTEEWPPLDNGERVPSRVPFRNITFQSQTRTFKGDICWAEDYGTTWAGETKWSYKIVFDPAFIFVQSGTVSCSTRGPHQFGIDLIYINAAIETFLRTSLAVQSTGEYLDVVRQWGDNNASSGTLQMLGQIAMSVMGDRESMIDFNL